MSRPPALSFRLCAKRILLTYPQVDPSLTKETVLERLREKQFGTSRLEKAYIALEHHQDGHPHLHIATSWTGKLNLHSSKCFDFVTTKHGDYQGIKSWPATLKYLMKEDQTPLTFGILPQELEHASKGLKSTEPTKTQRIATSLFTGEKSLRDILR